MTNKTLKLGDSQNYLLSFTDGVGAPIDITGAVLKFAIKANRSLPNSTSIVFKTSYDSEEIEITDAAGGQALLKLLSADTYAAKPGDYYWDVELTRPGALVVSGGASVSAGVSSVSVSGDLTSVKYGDVIVLSSGSDPANQKPATVVGVAGSAVLTDYDGWQTESGLTASVYRGDRKTPMGGTWTLSRDVVL